jgi:hypothetical protein
VRVLYAARIADCRSCPLRMPCQGHGTSTKKPRRVSAVLHPLPQMVPEELPPSRLCAPHPGLLAVIGRALSLAARGYNGNAATWSRWKRCPFHRFVRLLRLSRGQSVRIGV